MKPLTRLHAVRGFASLYVVISHAKFILWCGGTEYLRAFPRSGWSPFDYLKFGLEALTSSGQQMVIVFFVLSGFFIQYSLSEHDLGVAAFYRNRLIRIYIPYVSSALLASAVLFLIGRYGRELMVEGGAREINARMWIGWQALTPWNFLLSLAFLRDREYIGFNFAYWSLLYEGMFYLMIPWVRRHVGWYFAASLAVYVGGWLASDDLINSSELLAYALRYNVFFALGGWMYANRQVLARLGRKPLAAGLVASALILAAIVLQSLHRDRIANLGAGAGAVLLVASLLEARVPGRIGAAALRFFVWLGTFSYSLYITHLPILFLTYLLMVRLTGQVVQYTRYYPLGVLAAVALSYLFFRSVEKPSLRLLHRSGA